MKSDPKFNTYYYDISKRVATTHKSPIESDTSFSEDEKLQKKKFPKKKASKCQTQRGSGRLPIIPKRKYTKKTRVFDFTSEVGEKNTHLMEDTGKHQFGIKSDDDRLLTISPSRKNQTKMRQYYDHNLWSHMHDFRNEGKTKISLIRKKYSKLLSPEVKMRPGHASQLNFTEPVIGPPIIFAKRDYNDKFRYEQMKEINSLKDRLAKDGV